MVGPDVDIGVLPVLQLPIDLRSDRRQIFTSLNSSRPVRFVRSTPVLFRLVRAVDEQQDILDDLNRKLRAQIMEEVRGGRTRLPAIGPEAVPFAHPGPRH